MALPLPKQSGQRVDPADGRLYTWEAFCKQFAGHVDSEDLQSYWASMAAKDTEKKPVSVVPATVSEKQPISVTDTPPAQSEQRVDPADGHVYTREAFFRHFQGCNLRSEDIDSYWACMPAKNTPPAQSGSDEGLAGAGKETKPSICHIKVSCDSTAPGETVAIVGSCDILGCWDPEKAIELSTTAESFPLWSVDIPAPAPGSTFKVIKILHNCDNSIEWEPLEGNRTWPERRNDEVIEFGTLRAAAPVSEVPSKKRKEAEEEKPEPQNASLKALEEKPQEIKDERRELATSKPVTNGLKLYYWPTQGRAQQIRLCLAEAGATWEDINFDLRGGVQVREEFFAKCKTLGGNTTTNVPMLEMDGKFYTQSSAVLRLVARRHGLYPSSVEEAYQVDNIIAAADDLRTDCNLSMRNLGATEERQKQFRETILPNHLTNFERLLESKSFFVGESVSVADIGTYDVLTTYVERMVPGVLASYPGLKAFCDKMSERTKIAAYQSSEQYKALRTFRAM